MSDKATQSDLPIEVVEHVLDQLRGDAKTLAACCRVCSAWYPRARYDLYSVVDLDAENSTKFYETVVRDPSVASFMREFTFYGIWSNLTPLEPAMPLYTTGLQILRLRFVDVEKNPWLSMIMHHATRSITKLGLHHCFVDDVPGLMHLLAGLPNLKHFAAAEMFINARPDEATYRVTDFPKLQSLCLVGFGSLPLRLVRAFLAAQGMGSLLALHLQLSMGELPEFGRLLERVASTLYHLDLTVVPDDAHLDPDSFPLSLHTCLRLGSLSLSIRLCPPKPVPSPPTHLFWVPRLLDTVRSQHIRQIKLAVRATGATAQDLDNLDWHAVERVLAKARFASLRRVVVTIARGGGLEQNAVPYVGERLAALDKRGILRCVQTDI
ncbi:hypothetical protein BN946_scf184656.g5 [Trametes cinnabarina]|uniref:F-box domain-containing protein n=1 Tax=Pycnoporus cinnabarinus TaxID=5643 RepID=A0A060S8L0_PYCCI|nr:hypothetical protein BN946_scf184656.g5 [Trametes cinnabarina]